MSWSVNGVTYHNREEYQRALARFEQQQARNSLTRAREEVQRHQSRINQLQAELASAHGNIQRQIEINQRIQTEVQGIAREQSRLEVAQREAEARLNAGLADARRAIQSNQDQVRRLAAEHTRHVAETREMFDEARREMAAGFAEAERRRAATEQKLNEEIKSVDAKVEEDRRRRVARETSETQQATIQIGLVEEQLAQVASETNRLSLTEDSDGIRMQLAQAKALLAQGNSTAALANTSVTFAESRALIMKMHRRSGELAAAASVARDRVAGIERTLSDAGVERYFKRERTNALVVLQRLKNRVDEHYQRYARLEHDKSDNDKVLTELESAASDMVTSTTVVKDRIADRAERAQAIVDRLASIYGRPEYQSRYLDKDDRKSPLIVDCVFGGGEKVMIKVSLDGQYEVNAFHHSSQEACDRGARDAFNVLTAGTVVDGSQTLVGNPQDVAAPDADASPRWTSVSERLERVGKAV